MTRSTLGLWPRTWFLCAAIIAAAACGGGSGGGSPPQGGDAGNPPPPVVDAGGTPDAGSDAGTPPADGGSDAGTGGGTTKVGRITLDQQSIGANFHYDASALFARYTLLPGGTATPCPQQVNVTVGACIAAVICNSTATDAGTPTPPAPPQLLNAGPITFTDGAATATVVYGPFPGATPPTSGYNAVAGATRFFSPGDTITVTGAGGPDLPAFAQTLVAPGDVTVTVPACTGGCPPVDRTVDLPVAWTGGGAGKVFISFETLSATLVTIASCNFNAADGMGTVPASILSHLDKAGDPGVTGIYAAATTNEGPSFLVGDIPTTFGVQGQGSVGYFTVSK